MVDRRWQLINGRTGNRRGTIQNATIEPAICMRVQMGLDKAMCPLYNAASSGGKPSSQVKRRQYRGQSGEEQKRRESTRQVR
jgi:hypothetical protein